MSDRPYRRSLGPGQIRSDLDADVQDELELYLELRTEELVAEGVEPSEARRLAEERFGDRERIEASMRQQIDKSRRRREMTMWMENLRQDFGYALRAFRRSPGFTIVAVLTLGLAIGSNTAIFSVVDAALLRALPFQDADRLVVVNGYQLTDGEIAIRGASFPEFQDWEQRSRGISPMAAVGRLSFPVTGDGEAESMPTEAVSASYFDVFGVDASLGRTFTPEEYGAGAGASVVVISHGLWVRRYASDPTLVGRSISISDQPFTVVGVLPEGFGGRGLDTELWIPDGALGALGLGGFLESRGDRFLDVVGRLTTDLETAQGELDTVARELQAEYPETHRDRFAQVQGFREAYLGSTGQVLWVLLGAGGVLLLIAAANVSNLLLVRSHGRMGEIVVRRALGARVGRMARQLVAEGIVLGGLGSVLGVAVAYAGLRLLGPKIPQGLLPGYVDVHLSGVTLAFSLVVLVFVSVVMGLVPAFASTRVEIANVLREGGRGAAGSRSRFAAQNLFVVAQIALTLMLLSGAGLLERSLRAQLDVATGVELDQVVALRVGLPGSRYPNADARRAFADEIVRRTAELPGVTSASISSDLPFRGGSSGAYVYRVDAPDERIRFHRHHVTPQYFETLGIRLAAGRLLNEDDVDDAPGVGVITAAMAERVFPGENPVGQSLYLSSGGRNPFEIVGVVEDVRFRDLTTSLMAEGNSPDVFFAYDQIPAGSVELAARVQGNPASFIPSLREIVTQMDPEMPIYQPEALATAYRAQTATPRFAAYLMGLFSALAAVLACVGIYGVLAFAVGQRSQELAIRRAIGASGSSVARDVIGGGLKLATVGLVLGVAGAVAGSGVLESILYEVDPADPLTLALVAGVMVAVAITASALPALRAVRKDPMEALHAE